MGSVNLIMFLFEQKKIKIICGICGVKKNCKVFTFFTFLIKKQKNKLIDLIYKLPYEEHF